jgi:hypothetical protein
MQLLGCLTKKGGSEYYKPHFEGWKKNGFEKGGKT